MVAENVLTQRRIPYARAPNLRCIAANAATMNCPGEVTLKAVSDDGIETTIDALVSSDVSDEIFVSWHDLVALQILPANFPRAISSSLPGEGGSGLTAVDARVAALSTQADTLFQQLKDDFADVLSNTLKPTPINAPPMKIRLKAGATPKKILYTKQVPLHLNDAAIKFKQKLLDAKIIERYHEHSEWCAPGFYVPKPPDNTDVRLVTDFTYLNSQALRPEHPFPSALEIVRSIPATARIFLKMDCVAGYFQLALDKESQPLTVFMLPDGRYIYLRAPMGFGPSSDHWNNVSDQIIEGLPWARKIVDDVLLWSHTFEEIFERARIILTRCRKLGITISLKKLECGHEILFAGHLISSTGVRPDPAKTAAISDFPRPQTTTDLRSFFGLVNQLGMFLPDLAQMSPHLRGLLKADSHWSWQPEHEEEFEEIKKVLTGPNVVKPFDPKLNTELLTDSARLSGMGYALIQREVDPPGQRLICCGSKAFTPTQMRYSTMEVECLGIVWAIKHCKFYTLGMQHFEVHTDHSALVGVFKQPLREVASPRCRTMREKVSGFNFTVKHVRGKTHYVADALSRYPKWSPEPDGTEDESVAICYRISLDPAISQLDAAAAKDKSYLAVRQLLLEGCKPDKIPKSHPARPYSQVWDDLAPLDAPETTLLVLNGKRLVIPDEYKSNILRLLHLPHAGEKKTAIMGRQLYFWPSMNRDILNMVKGCVPCQKYQPSMSRQPLQLHDTPTCPMSHLGMDLFELEGMRYLVVVDRFSGFPFAFRMHGTTTRDVTDIISFWFDAILGWPMAIRSDGGPQFRSEEFEAFCKAMHIKHELSSSYNPQSNGLAESAVKQTKYLLAKCLYTGEDFNAALLEYRNTPRADGFSPAQMFFGRRQRTRLPTLPQHHQPIDMDAAIAAREDTALKAKSYFDTSAREAPPLQPGTRVWVQDPKTHRWVNTAYVKEEREHGNSYVLEPENGGRPFIRSRVHLRPRVGTEECADEAHFEGEFQPRRSQRLAAKAQIQSTPDTSIESNLQRLFTATLPLHDFPPLPDTGKSISKCFSSSTRTTSPWTPTTAATDSTPATTSARTRRADGTSSSSIWAPSGTASGSSWCWPWPSPCGNAAAGTAPSAGPSAGSGARPSSPPCADRCASTAEKEALW